MRIKRTQGWKEFRRKKMKESEIEAEERKNNYLKLL